MGLNIQRQNHREIFLFFRNHAAGIAINHRDGRSPITLPRNVPVAQPPMHRSPAALVFFNPFNNFKFGRVILQAIKFARIEKNAGFCVRFGHILANKRNFPFRLDYGNNGNAVFARKIKVALVVCGNGHYRARAIVHQHKIAHPNRHLLAGERVHAISAGEHSLFFKLVRSAVNIIHINHFFAKRLYGLRLGLACNQPVNQRMLRGKGHESYPKNGIGPGGKHGYFFRAALYGEIDIRASGFADPVVLHGNNPVGPVSFQQPEVFKQLFRILGNFGKPLSKFLFLYNRITAPAFFVNHLLVGEHGVTGRAPVLGRVLAIHQPLLIHFQEKHLLPAVILHIAGGHFAVPVIGVAKPLQLAAHVVDI